MNYIIMKKSILSLFIALGIAVLFLQPANAQNHSEHHQEAEKTEQFNDVPEDFKAMFTEAVEVYTTGKDALFESDLKSATAAFETFTKKLEEIGVHGLSGSGHMAWMESYEALTGHASDIISAENIEEARKSFRLLSEDLIAAVNSFGIDGVVYQQYCPMAMDSVGANWLSQNEQVQNPYTPETMPGCGEVIEQIES